MKKYLLLIPILFYAQTCFGAFSYSQSYTIDHTKIPNTDQSNFPVDIDVTQTGMKTVANGGHVQNANGYDVYAYTDNTCTTRIPLERELYTATTGRYTGWVKVSSLSHTVDTVIYLCYGDSGVSTDPNSDGTYGATSVWDTNFKIVSHFPNGTSLSTTDSTSNAYNGTATGAVAGAGATDGAAAFDGLNDHINYGNPAGLNNLAQRTISFWLKRNSALATAQALVDKDVIGTQWELQFNSSNVLRFGQAWSGSNGNWITTNSFVSTTIWYYIVVTYNNSATSNDPIIYVNNVVQTFSTDTNPTGSMKDDSALTMQIGENSAGSGDFDGLIDEFRLSNSIRSADWVATEYNNQSATSTFYTLGAEQLLNTTSYISKFISMVSFILMSPLII